jgi:hypothetical protein
LPYEKVLTPQSFSICGLKSALDVAGPTLVEVDVASIGAIPPYFPYDQKPKAA